ncbi:MAG: right-handed parallel beta-helix repeat-containing protein [Gemmatimonadetes bacterium]|nr:right-handed parallel beta-helix repeat-containing protein [Gemmatimonadota bacterium]
MQTGTTFVFGPGTYRGFSIRPKDSTTFIAQPGVVLNGSIIIEAFDMQGDVWVATGITAQGRVHGNCKDDGPMCSRPEDIYIDSVLSQQVEFADAVGPGEFHLDYESGTLTIGDSPDGRIVELTVTKAAFFGNASNVTIEGFVIEKYANPAQTGAIHAKRGSQDLAVGWIIRNNEVRWNHGTGIKMGRDTLVSGNFVHHNGQLGIGSGSTGTGNIVENNEISYNTTIPFSVGWEAGGAKFGKEEGLLVRGNYVHNNYGPGLWVDVGSKGIVFDNNIVAYNNNAGIYYEISYDATIKNNTVVGNGFESPWLWGPGILIAHSPNADVYNNVVVDNAQGIIGIQQPRGSGTYGAFEVRNMKVYNNVIVSTDGETGIAQPASNDPAIFNTWGNDFYDNTYYFDDIDAKNYRWKFSIYTKSQWQSVDNDTDGEWFNRDSFTMPPLPPEGLSWKGPSSRE